MEFMQYYFTQHQSKTAASNDRVPPKRKGAAGQLRAISKKVWPVPPDYNRPKSIPFVCPACPRASLRRFSSGWPRFPPHLRCKPIRAVCTPSTLARKSGSRCTNISLAMSLVKLVRETAQIFLGMFWSEVNIAIFSVYRAVLPRISQKTRSREYRLQAQLLFILLHI